MHRALWSKRQARRALFLAGSTIWHEHRWRISEKQIGWQVASKGPHPHSTQLSRDLKALPVRVSKVNFSLRDILTSSGGFPVEWEKK